MPQSPEDRAAALKDEAIALEEAAKAREREAGAAATYTEKLELMAMAREQDRKAAEKMLEAQEKLNEAGIVSETVVNNYRQALRDAEKDAKKAAGAQKKFGTSLFETLGFQTDMEKKQKSLTEKFAESDNIVSDLTESFKELASSGALTEGIMRGVDDVLIMLAVSAFEIAMANDKALASFNKATGTGGQYEDQLNNLYKANNRFGVSMEDNTAAFGSLFANVSQFSAMGSGMQDQLTQQAALLEKVGVANDDYSASIEISTKMLGMSTEAAMDSTNRLTAIAKDMGVAPAEMIKNFTAAGPALAKFGDQGVEVFADLAAAAKATGIATERLLDITSGFDTFEGAAKQVGSLNAILGGDYLNSMEMITETDPTARLQKMKDAIDAAGMSFDSMSYYERIALQEAMGLKDVGELAMLMSGDLDQFGSSTQQSAEELIAQQEAAKEAMDMMTELKAILADNSQEILGFIQMGMEFVKVLMDMSGFIKVMIPLLAILSVSMKVLAISQMFVSATGAALGKRLGLILLIVGILGFILFKYPWGSNFAEALIVLGLAFIALAAGVYFLDKTGKRAIPFILALGAAIMMMGAGIGMAATGMASLADSVSKLNPQQLDAFNMALIALVGILLIFGIAVATLGMIATGPQALGILTIAAAFFLIGAGIGLAAAGIGQIAVGFATLFEAIDVNKLDAIMNMFATIAAGAIFMLPAAVGMVLMAVGFGALALALAFIKTEDLQAIATFAEAMANIEYDTLTAVADEIERMAAAIDAIPTSKTVLLTGLFKTGAGGLLAGAGGGAAAAAEPAPPAPIELHIEVHVGNEQLDEHIRTISSEEQQQSQENFFSTVFRN